MADPHHAAPEPGSPPLLHIQAGVARLTLNRPAHRNRLHQQDLATLLHHFQTINADTSVRVAVLSGAVQAARPVFCAGYHLGQEGSDTAGEQFEPVAEALEALRPITVCASNGSVYGGATDLVLACDFAIGVQGMEMRMPAAALGLHYYAGGISRFVSRLGVTQAKHALLGARTFSDQDLLRMGFVQELVPGESLQAAVQAQVDALLQLAPLALQAMKASLNEVARGEFDAARLRERQRVTQASQDFAEGRAAFTERRAPRFVGK